MSRIPCSPAVVSGQARLVQALRPALALLAAGLLCPGWALAAVVPRMPEKIVVEDMDNDGDLVFVLYLEGQFDRGVLLDPKTAERLFGAVRLPPGLPEGQLSLLAVPRGLVGEGRAAPDPAWLESHPPGVVRVTGLIHHYPVEKSRVLHRYKLEEGDDGLKVTLLNPDVLKPYPPEDLSPAKASQPAYLWLALAGAVAVLIAGVAVVWVLTRRSSEGGSRT